MKLYLNDLGLLSAAGNGKTDVMANLLDGNRSGLVETDAYSAGHRVFRHPMDVQKILLIKL